MEGHRLPDGRDADRRPRERPARGALLDLAGRRAAQHRAHGGLRIVRCRRLPRRRADRDHRRRAPGGDPDPRSRHQSQPDDRGSRAAVPGRLVSRRHDAGRHDQELRRSLRRRRRGER